MRAELMSTLGRVFRPPWEAVRRLPLRVQLVVALVGLFGAVLIGSYFVASATMQQYRLHQVDSRLGRTTEAAERVMIKQAQTGQLPDRVFVAKPPVQDIYQVQIRL